MGGVRPLAEPGLLLFPWIKRCWDSRPRAPALRPGPHCRLAPASAVEEARKDGVKGAEPGWLGSLVPGVEFPSCHVLGGHTVSR